jgi:hypothetical protein
MSKKAVKTEMTVFEKLPAHIQTKIDDIVGRRLIDLILDGRKIIATPEEIEGMREDVICELAEEGAEAR